jgi:hypothetical protein
MAGLVGCGVTVATTSCKSGDKEFDDFEGGTTVYFAYQSPVRTIVLGDDEYDLTLDHAHKCQIQATFGGSYNGSGGSVQIAVDNSLVQNLTFADGTPVKAMPENYYQLSTNTLNFNGTFNGITEVQLSDAFFNDPDATKNTYVIPVVMTSQNGFGKILTGTLKEGGSGVRTDASSWEVLPMDYVLYCVKFQNKYSGWWLTNGNTSTDNIEKASQVQVKCNTINSCIYTVSYQKKYQAKKYDKNGNEVPTWEERVLSCDLLLTFDGNDKCTITSLTPGYTVTGNGSWVDDGEKKSWNNKDRDAMELQYTVDFGVDDYNNAIEKGTTHEKMVWMRSGVKFEEFSPIYTK